MNALAEFLSKNYVAAGLLALVGVFVLLVVHGLTGSRKVIKTATKQYLFIAVMVLLTPLLLWMLTTPPIR